MLKLSKDYHQSKSYCWQSFNASISSEGFVIAHEDQVHHYIIKQDMVCVSKTLPKMKQVDAVLV
jgi:hypothetical protein